MNRVDPDGLDGVWLPAPAPRSVAPVIAAAQTGAKPSGSGWGAVLPVGVGLAALALAIGSASTIVHDAGREPASTAAAVEPASPVAPPASRPPSGRPS